MKYVIIGGDAAGMSAAMQIYRQDENAEIITLEAGEIYSYAQCGLPYILGGEVEDSANLIARDVDTFREKYGIDARVNHEVTSVDADKKEVTGTDNSTGKTFQVTYDKLLIASGGRPLLPNWPGRELEGVHTLKTIPDAETIKADLAHVNHVTVVGGGYIGLEVAENCIHAGKKVTLLQRGDQLANIFDSDMAEYIAEEAEANGIELLLGENVQHLSGKSRVEAVHTDRRIIETDAVIAGVGLRPNTEMVSKCGLFRHGNGALQVNRYMETNISDIYAAGDCATQFHRIKEIDDYLPLGTHANKQGRVAGINMAGSVKSFKGVTGTSILRFFSLTLGKTGISDAEAADMRFPHRSEMLTTSSHAGYFPGNTKLHVKVTYCPDTGIILGGQLIGGDGTDKRLDVLATALFHRMTVSDFEDLDLSYAPPYNKVWDPLQQVIRRAK